MIGLPDDEYGEEVGAAVALKDGATVTRDELREFVKEPGRRVQVPAPRVARRRSAEGPDGQDPQARDRAAGGRVSAGREQWPGLVNDERTGRGA